MLLPAIKIHMRFNNLVKKKYINFKQIEGSWYWDRTQSPRNLLFFKKLNDDKLDGKVIIIMVKL